MHSSTSSVHIVKLNYLSGKTENICLVPASSAEISNANLKQDLRWQK